MYGQLKLGRWLAIGMISFFGAAACVSSAGTQTADSTAIPSLTAGSGLATPTTEPLVLTIDSDPGELVWVHDREPPDLHFDDPNNGTDIAAWIQEGLVEGLFGVDQAVSYYPELLDGEPTVTVNDDGTVVIAYRLRLNTVWSDGQPLTADDVAYTHQIIIEGCEAEADGSIVDSTNVGCEYDLSNRIGYDLVTNFEVTGPQSFTVALASFFPNWRSLYSHVFAEHAFGPDARAVNDNLRRWRGDDGILPSSGPLLFEAWTKGRSLELGRNEQYHGSVSPDVINNGLAFVDGVRIVFMADREAGIDALLLGQAHIIVAQPDPAFARLVEASVFTLSPNPGPVYEHWGLNLLNPHLAKPEVREAIAYALDKAEIVDQLYQPLFGGLLPEAGLGNAYWMPNQASYVDHQEKYAGNNVAAAAVALASAGYVEDNDGVWTHPVDGRLSLRVGTTAGNALRDRALELGRAQLGRAGIEVRIESAPGGLFLTEGPFAPEALEAAASTGRAGNPRLWDIAQFAWATGPWPGAVTGSYRSGSRSNPYGFSNPEFDVAATDCDALSDDGERAECYNQLDTFVTTLDRGDDGLFIIPLTQRPRLYGYVSAILASAGVSPDGFRGGPLVNVVDFRFFE